MAAHRRPRLPRRRPARRLRSAEGRDHRRRPQRVPRGRRARRRRGRGRAGRQRDRLRQHRPQAAASRSSWSRRPRARTCTRCTTPWSRTCADAVGVPPVEVVLVRPGHAAQDVVGEVAAFAVSRPLPRRPARAGLIQRAHPAAQRPNRFRTQDPVRGNRTGRMGSSHMHMELTTRPPGRPTPESLSPTAPVAPARSKSSRAHPPVPRTARVDVRVADAGVLHAGVRLRRDLPRHAGARAQRRRPALRGGDRPQAADRALRVHGDLHVLRDQRALVRPRRRHARGRADRRCCSPSRPGDARLAVRGIVTGRLFVVAMVLFAPQDGQAANFEVFMLPSMTAAILFTTARPRLCRGCRDPSLATLAKQTGAATLLPVVYLVTRARGRRASARSRSGSPSLPRSSRSRSVRRSSCTGPCSATVRTSA